MPTLESLQKDIEDLKKQNKEIIQALSALVPKDFSFQEKEPEIPPVLLVEPEKVIPQITPEEIAENKAESKKEANAKSAKLEEKIGIKLFSRLGIIALVIGIGFFIKYVNDNNLISYAVRIWLGVLAGVLLVAGGEFASRTKKYANWGKVLVGGGLATIYFVAYAAYAFVDYRVALGMTQAMDVVLLVLIALLAVIFSIRDNSQIIAAEAFSLGFLTCLLNNDFGSMVLVYDFILTLALVVTAAYKKWPIISIGGVICSYLVYSLWRADNPNANLLAISFLSLFFLSYVLQSVLFSNKLAGNKQLEAKVVSASVLNSLFFFVCGILVTNEWKGDWNALFCFIFSIFHLFSSWAAWYFSKKISSYIYFYFGIASLAVAVPLWLDKEMITIVWSALSLIVLLAGLKTRYRPFEYAAYILSFLTAWKVLLFDSFLPDFSLDNILGSTRVIAYLVAAAFFFVTYLILVVKRDNISETFKNISPYFYSILPSSLLFIMFIIEVGNGNLNWLTLWWGVLFFAVAMLPLFKKFKEFSWQGTVIGFLVASKVLFYDFILVNLQGEKLEAHHLPIYLITIALFLIASIVWQFKKNLLDKDLKQMPLIYQWFTTGLIFLVMALEFKGYHISIAWTVLASALIAIGFILKDQQSRCQALIVLAFVLLNVLFAEKYYLPTAIMATALFFGASIAWRFGKGLLSNFEKNISAILQWLAVGLAFWTISSEFNGYGVSVGWAILALVLIFAGFLIKDKNSRYQGIVILGFTLLKVFLYDTSTLETIYRTISYMFLGGILLGASFLYSKYKDKILG